MAMCLADRVVALSVLHPKSLSIGLSEVHLSQHGTGDTNDSIRPVTDGRCGVNERRARPVATDRQTRAAEPGLLRGATTAWARGGCADRQPGCLPCGFRHDPNGRW